ncbi:MAG: HAD-IIIA family hydrolase, partial [Actinomycetes bacterium]
MTTNGTVWNDLVERTLEQLDFHISVSVDGMSRSTFESIRVGASFDDVMRNIDRFVDYTSARGTNMTMSWSLIRSNWWELGAAMRFAEERGIQIKVQTVIEPEFGVQRMSTDELRVVVESLHAESRSLVPDLTLNREMWEREVARLDEELSLRASPHRRARCMEPPGDNPEHVAAMVLDTADRRIAVSDLNDAIDVAVADLRRWCGDATIHRVTTGPDGRLRDADVAGLIGAADEPPSELRDVLQALESYDGGAMWIAEEFDETDRLVQTLWMGRPTRDKVGHSYRLISIATDEQVVVLIALDGGLHRSAPTPVSLRSRVETARPTVTHVLVDRDGVLNRELGDGWVTSLGEWAWEEGAVEALRRLAEAGIGISVVTNQSCIGRGTATAADVERLHEEIAAQLRASIGVTPTFFVCPHAPDDGCSCRKPLPGLLRTAISQSGSAASNTVMIGDDLRDLRAGRAAGVATALVRTGKGSQVTAEDAADSLVAGSL